MNAALERSGHHEWHDCNPLIKQGHGFVRADLAPNISFLGLTIMNFSSLTGKLAAHIFGVGQNLLDHFEPMGLELMLHQMPMGVVLHGMA